MATKKIKKRKDASQGWLMTFTDMLMERNTLMEYVYPKIKEYCREKHGLEFQVLKLLNYTGRTALSILTNQIKFKYVAFFLFRLSI